MDLFKKDNNEKNIGARNRACGVVLRAFDNFTYRRGLLGIAPVYGVLIRFYCAYATACKKELSGVRAFLRIHLHFILYLWGRQVFRFTAFRR